MRSIQKGPEPESLTQHRLRPAADYDNYADKEILRHSLASEQRGLCCYCLSRIRPAGMAMKIEHWHSREQFPGEQLDYRNLLGACLGNEGRSFRHQHCDTRKGSRILSRNPARTEDPVERLIRFGGDGVIYSEDAEFNRELNEVLNLNLPMLVNNRKAVLDAFVQSLSRFGALNASRIEGMIRDWGAAPGSGDLPEYCAVVTYWLRKRLARA